MNNSIPFVSCLHLLFASVLLAQPAPPKILAGNSNLLPTTSVIDPIGEELQAVLIPPAPDEQDQAAQIKAQRKQADRFLSTADRAKAFRAKYPDKPEVVQAKSLEAKSLLSAALAADNSQMARTAALVADIRADPRVPAKARLEVAALSETVRLQPMMQDQNKFLAASEASVRNLIAEFPGEAGGYDALFRIAQGQSDEAKGIVLAQEVMTMPAPASVKELVQVFLDRQALVGQSLPKIANTALGSGNVISAVQGKPIILYSWASWNPGSIAWAKNLNKLAPTGAVLIGVNLDTDPAAAKSLAQTESLPGSQVYDGRGFDSPLVRSLKLTTAVHVYVTNASGVIREVSAQRGDFTAKFVSAIR